MKLEKKPKRFCWQTTILVIGLVLVVSSFVASIFGTSFFEKKIQKNLILSPNSSRLNLWINPPVKIYRKFYFFHVENPSEVLEGSKPILTEKGPYVYREEFEKRNVEFVNSTFVKFNPVYSFYFEPNKSNGSDQDYLTILNIPLIVVVEKAIKSDKVSGINMFFSDENLFISQSVHDILFGYESSTLQLANSVSENHIEEIFGILKKKHGIESEEFIIDSGLDDATKTGKIIEWNGKSKLDFWYSENANQIKGSDGTINPTFIKRNQQIDTFNSDLCRSYKMQYARDSLVKGVKTFDFILPDDIFYNSTLNPDNEGFCEENCLGNGVFNTSQCKDGAPLFLSLPHFLNADKKFLDDVVGLSPKKEIHEFYLSYEPITGSTIGGNARIQMNVYIKQNKKVSVLHETNSVLLPFLWFEKTIDLSEKATDRLKSLGTIYKGINVMPLVLLIVGGAIKIFAIYFLFKACSKRRKHISKYPYHNSPIYNHETVNLNRKNIDM